MYTEQSKTRRQVIGVKALNNMDIGQLNPVGVCMYMYIGNIQRSKLGFGNCDKTNLWVLRLGLTPTIFICTV